MEIQRQEFRIGIMVLTAIVCLTLMTVIFSGQRTLPFSDDNLIHVRFQQLPGIKRNSPVTKNGVQIGRVSKVELVDQDREVEVTIGLNKNRKIYTNEECRIRQSMIMGEASLEFVKIRGYTGKVEEWDPAKPLVGGGSSDLMSGFGNIEGDLSKIIQNVAGAAEQLGTFVDRINTAIGTPEEFQVRQEKFEAIVEETRQTMASMRKTTDGISNFVNDPQVQHNVRQVIATLPDVIEKSRTLVGESTLFVHDARTLLEKGNVSLDNLTVGLERVSRTLEVVTKIANQVEGDVPEIITAVKRSAVRLSSLFEELTMIVQNFREADGTVKRLIRDPEAYTKIMATLDNVEKITNEVDTMLRVDVKPIAHNAKILTDKMARDPAVFIRSLIRKEPPTKPLAYLGYGSFGGTYSFPYIPSTTVIDGEIVEILEEVPVSSSPVRSASPLPLPSRNVAQRSRTPSSVYYESTAPVSAEGRIVNVDPRYSGY